MDDYHRWLSKDLDSKSLSHTIVHHYREYGDDAIAKSFCFALFQTSPLCHRHITNRLNKGHLGLSVGDDAIAKSFLLCIIPAAHFKSEAGRDVYSESTQFKFWPESVHSKNGPLWSEAALGFLGKQSCEAAGHLQCGWEPGFLGLQRFPKKNCTNSPDLEHFP